MSIRLGGFPKRIGTQISYIYGLCEVWDVYGVPRVVIVGGLCEVWEVHGDPMGSKWVVYMRFRKCMGTLGGHLGHLYALSDLA